VGAVCVGATYRVPQTREVRGRSLIEQGVLHHYTGIPHYSNSGESHPTAQDVKSWNWKSGGTTNVCVVCVHYFDGFDIRELDGISD